MNYYHHFSILLIAFVASILVFGTIDQVFDSIYAQTQEDSGDPIYPYPYAVLHKIEMSVQKIEKSGGGGDLYGYQLNQHLLFNSNTGEFLNNITNKYSPGPTIPGPSLLIEEGDSVELTLKNPDNTGAPGMVSIHVHGIHYSIASDGTLGILNELRDEGVKPGQSIKYHWTAGPGTAGTWPYHDHTLGLSLGHSNAPGTNMNGAETIGLFGTLVIDSPTGKTVGLIDGKPTKIEIADISKEVLCYVTDDAFWCDQIDYKNNAMRTALWENPTIGLKDGDLVRFHLYGMGTDFHIFELTGYQWLEPGTTNIISKKKFGPLENHVFTIEGKNGVAEYRDILTSHLLSGMKGEFIVNSVGESFPGKSPSN